ncbi:MAG: PQQ-binding-like beta-propeller repeat protein [Pseudomonadota bacterium]
MAVAIAHWAFIIFMGIIALLLTVGGGFLAYLGGSWYYLLAGLAVLVVTVMLVRRDVLASRLYLGIVGITLVWAVFESGLDFMALLPRLAAWLVVGFWFLSPWYLAALNKRYGDVQPRYRTWLSGVLAASAATLLLGALQPYTKNGTGTVRAISDTAPVTDWRQYGNSDSGSRFAEIDQINADTVSGLTEAWRFRTGVEDDFKMTPLQVGGRLFICTARNIIIALNDDTGAELWRYDPDAVPPAAHQYARTCRGLSFYEAPANYSGQCRQRLVMGTIDARLIAVNAETGQVCDDFGAGGEVDLRKGLSPHGPNDYYVTSPPLVADDVFVVGGLVNDSQKLGLPSGVVRAFDAITGAFVWAWDVGNPDDTSEPEEGAYYTPGTPNVWSIMSYDPDLDLIYAPTGNANPDWFGGARRPFDEEWSAAVVALDGATGTPAWKFQTVHHDIWDYDVPAQPVLVDVDRDGERIPSVAVPTKRGEIFLLDRRDGTPVHPIEEREVPQIEIAGDYLSPTQPFSSLPNFRPYRHEKDMWGLTPLDQMLCRIEYQMMHYEGHMTPPTPGGSLYYPANFGGFNWGSVSVDADNGLLIAAPMMLASRLMLVTPEQVAEAGPRAALMLGPDHPAVRMDPEAPMPEPREPDPSDPYDHVRVKYYGLPLPFMSRFVYPIFGSTQVPCFEPPWSRIAVIDLNTNELLWSRPVGSMKQSGPFGWRMGLPFQVGTPIRAGTMTTRGGLTFLSSTMDSTVRAFNVRTGKVEWAVDLPGNGQSTPMSYVSPASGKQFIIVTVPNPSWRYPRDPANGTYTDSKSIIDGEGGYVIAFALPDPE